MARSFKVADLVAGALEEEFLDVELGEAARGNRVRVLGAEGHQDVAPDDRARVVVSDRRHGIGDHGEGGHRGGADVVVDVVGAFAREHRDRAVAEAESAGDPERLPGRGRLVLRDATSPG
jgi:hypothetical protein